MPSSEGNQAFLQGRDWKTTQLGAPEPLQSTSARQKTVPCACEIFPEESGLVTLSRSPACLIMLQSYLSAL